MRVTLLAKPDCPECEEVRGKLFDIADRYELQIEETGTGAREDLHASESGDLIPIVEVQDVRIGRLVNPITSDELESYFNMAQAVLKSNRAHAAAHDTRESLINRMVGYIGIHWLRLAAIGLGVFVLLPWLAPVFAALGWWALADPIYTAYAFQCHQLPERAAHVFGYEVCQCWRCNALYGGMFLFALGYAAARDRDIPALRWLRRPVPPWAFVVLLLPILIDGISHMLGLREALNFGQQPAFGSFFAGSQAFSFNWTLRIITGLVAGLASIWFAFPRMQQAVNDAEALRLSYKLASRQAAAAES